MTPAAAPVAPLADLSLVDALVAESATVVDLALLERLFLELVELVED